jgi:hypothetical protein
MEVVIVVKQPNILEPFIKLPIKTGRGATCYSNNASKGKTYYLNINPGGLGTQWGSNIMIDPNSYTTEHPPQAVYTTRKLSQNDYSKYEYKYEIKLNEQQLGLLELDGDITIVKDDSAERDFFNIKLFGDPQCIVPYHSITIVPKQDILIQLKEIFHTRLPEFCGELTYKIMRRYTLLVRFVGKPLENEVKFKDLLRVNCDVLKDAVYRLASEFNVEIDSRVKGAERDKLNFLHFMLVNNNIRLPATLPIVNHIETQIDKLRETVGLLNDVYVSSREIMDLRALIESYGGSNDNLKETALALQNENNQLVKKLVEMRRKNDILKANAINDERTIETLRAEKAYWGKTDSSFTKQEQKNKELADLRDKLNQLLAE